MAAIEKHVMGLDELDALIKANKKASELIDIKPPKDLTKSSNGCKYYKHSVKLPNGKISAHIKIMDTDDENIIISTGLPDPTDGTDKRNAWKNKSIGTIMKNSGKFGKVITNFNTKFMAAINEKYNKDFSWKIGNGRKLTGLLSTHYGDEGAKVELRGTEKPDEYKSISFRIDFTKYNWAGGGQKTVIYDYDTKQIIGGKAQYEVASIDGVPLNDENAHKFLTRGSIIKRARFAIEDIPVHQQTVSMPILASVLWVQHHEPSASFDDEDDIVVNNTAAAAIKDELDVIDEADAEAEAEEETADEPEAEVEEEAEAEEEVEAEAEVEPEPEPEPEPVKPAAKAAAKVAPVKAEPAKPAAKAAPVKAEPAKPAAKAAPVKVEPAKPAAKAAPAKPAAVKPAAKPAAKGAKKVDDAESAANELADALS